MSWGYLFFYKKYYIIIYMFKYLKYLLIIPLFFANYSYALDSITDSVTGFEMINLNNFDVYDSNTNTIDFTNAIESLTGESLPTSNPNDSNILSLTRYGSSSVISLATDLYATDSYIANNSASTNPTGYKFYTTPSKYRYQTGFMSSSLVPRDLSPIVNDPSSYGINDGQDYYFVSALGSYNDSFYADFEYKYIVYAIATFENGNFVFENTSITERPNPFIINNTEIIGLSPNNNATLTGGSVQLISRYEIKESDTYDEIKLFISDSDTGFPVSPVTIKTDLFGGDSGIITYTYNNSKLLESNSFLYYYQFYDSENSEYSDPSPTYTFNTGVYGETDLIRLKNPIGSTVSNNNQAYGYYDNPLGDFNRLHYLLEEYDADNSPTDVLNNALVIPETIVTNEPFEISSLPLQDNKFYTLYLSLVQLDIDNVTVLDTSLAPAYYFDTMGGINDLLYAQIGFLSDKFDVPKIPPAPTCTATGFDIAGYLNCFTTFLQRLVVPEISADYFYSAPRQIYTFLLSNDSPIGILNSYVTGVVDILEQSHTSNDPYEISMQFAGQKIVFMNITTLQNYPFATRFKNIMTVVLYLSFFLYLYRRLYTLFAPSSDDMGSGSEDSNMTSTGRIIR